MARRGWVTAMRVDERIATVCAAHPRRFVVDASPTFLEKALHTIDLLDMELACCRVEVTPVAALAP